MKKYTVDIQERTLHFKQPAGTSRGVYTERKSWFVIIREGEAGEWPETAGLPYDTPGIGVGECAPLPDLSCDAAPNYANILRQFCQQLEETGQLDDDALRPYPSMRFGLETALLSLQHGQQLFDTAFSRGETGIPINGLVWMGNHDEMLHRMEEKLQQGFRCIKLKIGAIDFEQELDLIRRIRNRFSRHEVEIRLDANGAFHFLNTASADATPDDALYRLELLSQYAIHSIEQPIAKGQWAFMAELCRESPLPIALDEELIGVNDPETKLQLLNIIKPAYIVLKPSLHGGMQGCREWIDAARDMDIGSWITSALESNVGLNAIAQFASSVYGDDITMPQGLGTGLLFTDNIPLPLQIRQDKLYRCH